MVSATTVAVGEVILVRAEEDKGSSYLCRTTEEAPRRPEEGPGFGGRRTPGKVVFVRNRPGASLPEPGKRVLCLVTKLKHNVLEAEWLDATGPDGQEFILTGKSATWDEDEMSCPTQALAAVRDRLDEQFPGSTVNLPERVTVKNLSRQQEELELLEPSELVIGSGDSELEELLGLVECTADGLDPSRRKLFMSTVKSLCVMNRKGE